MTTFRKARFEQFQQPKIILKTVSWKFTAGLFNTPENGPEKVLF